MGMTRTHRYKPPKGLIFQSMQFASGPDEIRLLRTESGF